MTFDKSKYIDSKTLNPNVGSGNIKLSSKVKNDYARFLKNCIKYTKSNTDKKQVCYFAVTKDGKISGSDYSAYGGMVDRKESKQGAVAECMINSNKKRCFLYADEKKVIWKGNTNLSTETPKYVPPSKSMSSLSNKEVCSRATASNGLSWENANSNFGDYVKEAFKRKLSLYECRKLTDRFPKTETIAETVSKESSVKDRLKELKAMLDEGLISRELYDTKSAKMLEDF